MYYAPRLQSYRFGEAFDSLFVRRIGKFAVNGLCEGLQDRMEVGELVIPAAEDMPGIVVRCIEARSGFSFPA